MCQVPVAPQVKELVQIFNFVAFEVQHCQVLEEANIEELVKVVIADVELVKLSKSLQAVDVSELASGDVQNPDILKGCAYISEVLDD